MDDTFYIIYKITNNINGKIYIGAHITKDINDSYMGSGIALNRSKKKYGTENFTKEILHIFNNEKDMWCKEFEIVNEDFCKRKDTYNIRTGGIGGWNHWNGSNVHKQSSSKGGKTSSKKLNERIALEKANNTEWWQNWHMKVIKTNKTKNNNSWLNISEEEAQRRRKQKSLDSAGIKNSQFGKYWISNILTKEIKRITMDDIIPDGWVRGKKGHAPTKLWVNNGVKEKYVLIEKHEEFISKGYIRGRLPKSMPQYNSVKVEV